MPLATAVEDTRYCFLSQSGPHPESDGLTLLCAGRERCLPSYHVSRSDFNCLSIEFVVKGRGHLRYKDEDDTHSLFAGTMYAYGTGESHDIWSEPNDPMTKCFAAYRFVAGSLPSHLHVEPGMVRWTQDISAVERLFEELITEGQRTGEYVEETTSRYLELILLKAAAAVPANRGQHQGGSREVYEQALLCIQRDFAEITSLEELSARVGVGANYICRLFGRFADETPIQCLTRYKLNRAAELLCSQPSPVNEIAREVGYEDPYYFSRVFSKRFGCSPKNFRSQSD